MPAIAAEKPPGISVSDAFGLPTDWTLNESLKGVVPAGTQIEAKPEIPDDAPDPDKMEAEAKPAEGAESDETPADEGVDAGKAEADRIAEEKRVKKEAADEARAAAAKKVAAKPGEKPLVGAAKAAADKKAAEDAAKAKAAAAAAPKKVKVGDKEMTEAEIAEKIAKADKLEAAANAAAEAKKRADAEAARKAGEKQQTPEEKAAAETADQKKESEWIAATAANVAVTPMTEDSLEKILSGGKEAVAELDRIRREDTARTLLAARKDIGEMYKPMAAAVAELHEAHLAARDREMETAIISKFPGLADHTDLMRQHGMALVKADPEGSRAMTQEQFGDKVAELTIAYIRKFNPAFGQEPDAAAIAAAAAAGQTAQQKAAAASAKLATDAAARAAAAKRRTPAAPSGNLPGSQPSGSRGAPGKEFQRDAVATLM